MSGVDPSSSSSVRIFGRTIAATHGRCVHDYTPHPDLSLIAIDRNAHVIVDLDSEMTSG
jgi:hypothetical protein